MQTGKKPKVAVLMSVYSRERPEFLKESIESMFAQFYGKVDVHLFKDGLLGQTLEQLLADFKIRYPEQLFIYQNPVNRGLAICLNEMIQTVREDYDYFARMDSDDVAMEDRIEKQVAFMETHPEIDVVGGFIHDIDERGKILKNVKYPQTHDEIYRFFRKRNPIAHATVMYRRSYFDKAGLYPPVRLEDGLYWMQGFVAGCRFQNIPDYLVRVRRTDDFLKRRSGLEMVWKEFLIKLRINRALHYGPSAYFYTFATLGVQLMPVSIKQVLYNKLR